MQANLWVEKLNFKDGTSIQLKKDSIIVFVGANNSGKSLTLKEIVQNINGHGGSSKIVDSAKVKVEGSVEDFLEKISDRKSGTTYMFYESGVNAGMDANALRSYWEGAQLNKIDGAPAISNFFVKKMDTIQRLDLVSPVTNIDVLQDLVTHPLHELKRQQRKENLFSDYFKRAFGEDITMNHNYGQYLALHVGIPPIATVQDDRASINYQTELRKLPFLHEQGDGMKSFAGVFLGLFAQDFSVNLIDEPEAFLHPPQASLLGQMIAQKAKDKQIFVATHSEHFLKGLLDGGSEKLIIVRIQREDESNSIKVLGNEEIIGVWNDTLLRHSNVLDGLFHKKVILAESDSDCRFYSAILSAIIEDENIASPDLLFLSSAGKDRFPVVVKALKALEVPMLVIADFDLYNNENPMRKIYEDLGGDWEDIRVDFLKIKKSIDEKIKEVKTEDLKKSVNEILDSCKEQIITEVNLKLLQTAVKKISPWKQAKSSGKAYISQGEPSLAFRRVQKNLKKKKIIVLEIGEIEAFDKTVGGHGPRWVNEVLSKDILINEELSAAREFVRNFFMD